MKQRWRSLPICGCLTLMFLLAPAPSRADSPQGTDHSQAAQAEQIREATRHFYLALNAVLNGDLAMITDVWSHRPDVTNLSSSGGRDIGWNEIYQRYQNMVRLEMGGKIAPHDIVVVVGGYIGYSICTETGQTRTSAGSMQSYTKRATNIFRLEGGQWKLIHHHADPVEVFEP